jgi:hypothetical protein
MKLLYIIIILFSFSSAADRVSDNKNIFKSTILTIQNFQFKKYKLIDNVTNDYLNSLTKVQKNKLYDSLKQNIPLNMLLTAAVPTSGHFRINKGSRGLKIVGYGCLAFAIPYIPFVIDADVYDGGYVLIAAAFLSIPISYLYLTIDSGIQTAKYNNEIEYIIFKPNDSIIK